MINPRLSTICNLRGFSTVGNDNQEKMRKLLKGCRTLYNSFSVLAFVIDCRALELLNHALFLAGLGLEFINLTIS
jgi:hypothetical protein